MCKKGAVTTEKMVNVRIDQGPNQNAKETRVHRVNVVLTTTRGWSQRLLDRLYLPKNLPSHHQSPLEPTSGSDNKPNPSASNGRNDSTPNPSKGSECKRSTLRGRSSSPLRREMRAMRKQFVKVVHLMTEEVGVGVVLDGAWDEFLNFLHTQIWDLQEHPNEEDENWN
jgi:hypothetical protein